MVIVFDVNETLLDLKPLRPIFARMFGCETAAGAWFAQLLQNSLVATVTDSYRDFGELALDALGLLAARRQASLTQADKEEVFETLQSLPPHPDVLPNLKRLRGAGFSTAALTNSPYRVLEKQLANAGLADLFDRALSVDEVKLFKPHPAVYQMAASKLGVAVNELRLVAAHNWDTTGAIRAGARAAFVARDGAALGELDEQPDIIGKDLADVAEKISASDAP